jgi:nucleotide-binding universal stress UspA family protein
MRILMATDGSSRATSTLIAASRMLAPANRRVDSVTVVPRVPDHAHHSHRERLYRRAQFIADKTKAALAAEGVSVDASVRTGSPARILIGASYNYDVTILAAASRRSDPMAGLGPVASRVAEHARGAVLLAREGRPESGLRVLVAVDGSDGSLRALDLLAELVDLKEAEVTLLHVIETPWLHPGPDQEWLGYEEEENERINPDAQLQEVFVKEGDDILFAAGQRLPAGTAMSVLTGEGIPADEILSEVENGGYDLIAVGASGSLDMKHKILGSVSSKVAWNAPCSVLLVGPAAEAAA